MPGFGQQEVFQPAWTLCGVKWLEFLRATKEQYYKSIAAWSSPWDCEGTIGNIWNTIEWLLRKPGDRLGWSYLLTCLGAWGILRLPVINRHIVWHDIFCGKHSRIVKTTSGAFENFSFFLKNVRHSVFNYRHDSSPQDAFEKFLKFTAIALFVRCTAQRRSAKAVSALEPWRFLAEKQGACDIRPKRCEQHEVSNESILSILIPAGADRTLANWSEN